MGGEGQKRKIYINFQRDITLLIYGGLYPQTICAALHHGQLITINQVSA